MSARPRPVTATFLPRALAPPTGVRTRSYSLSSGSSTASLVSVLDHDSYESLGPDSDEEREAQEEHSGTFVRSPVQPQQSPHITVRQRTPGKPARKVRRQPQQQQLTQDVDVDESGMDTPTKQIEWEQWVVQKAKEDRQRQKQLQLQEQKKKEEEVQKQREKEEIRKKGEEKYQEWLEKKMLQMKIQKRSQQQQKKTKAMIEEEKRASDEHKIKDELEKWQEKKKQEERNRKKEEEEKKQQLEKDQEEKKKKSEEVYQKWLEDSKNRPRSAPNSYGFSLGKLTGYHDKSAYPVPAFYNPAPWIPNDIPKVPRVRKPKPKYKWNPKKYL